MSYYSLYSKSRQGVKVLILFSVNRFNFAPQVVVFTTRPNP